MAAEASPVAAEASPVAAEASAALAVTAALGQELGWRRSLSGAQNSTDQRVTGRMTISSHIL